MTVHERSDKGMGEWNLLRSGCRPRRVVAIFDQASERIDFGNTPTGLQGLLADSESVGRRMRREHQKISQPGGKVTSALVDQNKHLHTKIRTPSMSSFKGFIRASSSFFSLLFV